MTSVQAICGTLGNCGVGQGGVKTLPRHTVVPEVGRFDLGHDKRYGRYRYQQPDLQIDLTVPKIQPTPRLGQHRGSGGRTIYRVENLSADHVDWCFARYKSYRAKDNSYMPAKGERRQCVSPFS